MAFSAQTRYGPEPFTALTHPITKMAGSFKFEGKIWPDEADLSQVVDADGSAIITLTADGRFLHMTWEGSSVSERWSGSHAFGFDSGTAFKQGQTKTRGLKEVFYNRYGNFGTGTAQWDMASNRLEFTGMTDECGRGVEPYRTIFTIVNDNEFVMEVHMTASSTKSESKARELRFIRV